jgi:hypothetical protein
MASHSLGAPFVKAQDMLGVFARDCSYPIPPPRLSSFIEKPGR